MKENEKPLSDSETNLYKLAYSYVYAKMPGHSKEINIERLKCFTDGYNACAADNDKVIKDLLDVVKAKSEEIERLKQDVKEAGELALQYREEKETIQAHRNDLSEAHETLKQKADEAFELINEIYQIVDNPAHTTESDAFRVWKLINDFRSNH